MSIYKDDPIQGIYFVKRKKKSQKFYSSIKTFTKSAKYQNRISRRGFNRRVTNDEIAAIDRQITPKQSMDIIRRFKIID